MCHMFIWAKDKNVQRSFPKANVTRQMTCFVRPSFQKPKIVSLQHYKPEKMNKSPKYEEQIQHC